MRAFLMLYASDYEGDDDRYPHRWGPSPASERRAFTLLASVCSNWHLTLTGWPQSTTPYWFKHKVKKCIERMYNLTVSIQYA